jgi:Subtilase family
MTPPLTAQYVSRISPPALYRPYDPFKRRAIAGGKEQEVTENHVSLAGEEPERRDGDPGAREITRRSFIGGGLAAGAGVAMVAGLDATSARAAGPIARSAALQHTFPPGLRPRNPITNRVLHDAKVAWTIDGNALVMAVKDELLVRASAYNRSPRLRAALHARATEVGSLLGSFPDPNGEPLDDAAIAPPTAAERHLVEDTQLWRLNSPALNSIDEAKALNPIAHPTPVHTRAGGPLHVPAVSPNHVFVACYSYDSCPGGPPSPPTPPPSTAAIDAFILPPASSPGQVAVIDTGYIKFPDSDAAHLALTARVNSVPGYMLYSAPQNPHNSWGVCPPDAVRSVPGRPDVLDGVAGHGTFIAGIIASRCASAKLTVVGERRAVMPIAPTGALSAAQAVMVVTDELSLGRSLLRYGKGDVVSCGFAFPTLNTYPSIPVSLVMAGLLEIDPTWSHVAVMVAPAGNERSWRDYWPAAHPDVIGVASSNVNQNGPAVTFGVPGSGTNWGSWVKCCCRGSDVQSTFINWKGAVEDGPPNLIKKFTGWATWSGTSFAAPKVTAAIANQLAAGVPRSGAYTAVVAANTPNTANGLGTLTWAPPGGPAATLNNLHLG